MTTPVFDDWGIRFYYPENWTLEVSEELDDRTVSVISPGGAFWSVTVHSAEDDPRSLAAEAAEAIWAEYPDLDCEEVAETIDGTNWVGFDLNFFYLDLTSTACVRARRGGAATLVVFFQAEDRDFARLAEVFQAMTVSLVREGR